MTPVVLAPSSLPCGTSFSFSARFLGLREQDHRLQVQLTTGQLQQIS